MNTRIFLPIINVLLAFACLFHITINAYNILYPEIPSVKVYEKELGDIIFPASFKLCARDTNNSSKRYTAYGYEADWGFFYGQSNIRGGYVGWNGDFENGSLVHVKGTLL